MSLDRFTQVHTFLLMMSADKNMTGLCALKGINWLFPYGGWTALHLDASMDPDDFVGIERDTFITTQMEGGWTSHNINTLFQKDARFAHDFKMIPIMREINSNDPNTVFQCLKNNQNTDDLFIITGRMPNETTNHCVVVKFIDNYWKAYCSNNGVKNINIRKGLTMDLHYIEQVFKLSNTLNTEKQCR
jgi:hypothetical protein